MVRLEWSRNQHTGRAVYCVIAAVAEKPRVFICDHLNMSTCYCLDPVASHSQTIFPESEREPKADACKASGFSRAGSRVTQSVGNPLPLGSRSAYLLKMFSESQNNMVNIENKLLVSVF